MGWGAKALVALGLSAVLIAGVERPAFANGRFPGAYLIASEGDTIAIHTSFGLLVSRDRGRSFAWICERAMGYNPDDLNDMGIALLRPPGGELDASVDAAEEPSADPSLRPYVLLCGDRGLTLSSDGACTNTRVANIGSLNFYDVSVDSSARGAAFALLRRNGEDKRPAALYETRDYGRTFSMLGRPFDLEVEVATVDGAKGDPDRVYLTARSNLPGTNDLQSYLYVSNDRGANYTRHAIPGEYNTYIAGVDPIDPNVVYVRSLYGVLVQGRLWVTRNAGQTFQELADLSGVAGQFVGVTGFAIAPDGSAIAYGSINEGLFLWRRGAPEPEHVAPKIPIMGLHWREDGLYAASAPILDGPFFFGVSTDEGRTFEPLVAKVEDIDGENNGCPASSAGGECAGDWAAVLERLRSPRPPPTTQDASPPPPAEPSPRLSSCGCETLATSRYATLVGLGSLAVLVVGLARRRRTRTAR